MAKVTTALLDKSLKIISKLTWQERMKDDDYRILAKHEEPKMTVTAEWSGEILGAHKIAPSQRKPFALEVHFNQTHDSYGVALDQVKVVRDKLSCERYRTLEELEKAFNDYLVEYSSLPTVKTHKLTMGKDDPAPPVYVPPPTLPGPVGGDDDDDEDVAEEKEVEPPVIVADPNADKVTSGGGDW